MVKWNGYNEVDLQQVLLVGTGGFLGAIARFLVSKYANGLLGEFPLGTLIVNIVGSFLLGIIMYSILADNGLVTPATRSFVAVGFIGAFTTMSTFAYESFRLVDLSDAGMFGLNVALNVIGCLGAIYLGKQVATILTGLVK